MKEGVDSIPRSEFRGVIAKLVEIVLGRIKRVRSIVLFGSIARGDAPLSTDIDLIVVSDSFPERPCKSADPIIKAFLELKGTDEYRSFIESGRFLNIDPVGYRSSDLEAHTPPLMLDPASEGIMLYDDGFMEKTLGRIVKRMELGSRKVWTGRRWYWDLKPDYKFGEVVEI